MKRSLTTAIAIAALVIIAFAGGASAAKLITGKQIKDGTVTGADVKAGSLRGSDVKDGSLKGVDLKDGSATGADLQDGSVTGADLQDGTVEVDHLTTDAKVFGYTNGDSDIDITNCPDQTLTVCPGLATVLTSGPLAITATGTLDNLSNAVPTPTRCGLVYDGQTLGVARFSPNTNGQPGDLVPFTIQTVVNVAPNGDHVELRCTQFAGDDLHVLDLRVVAISVHALD